jgi:thiol-disulfide isomerase/thioredoxin
VSASADTARVCGPCHFIEPAFKEMASRYTGAAFVKIGVDELAVRTPHDLGSRFFRLLISLSCDCVQGWVLFGLGIGRRSDEAAGRERGMDEFELKDNLDFIL